MAKPTAGGGTPLVESATEALRAGHDPSSWPIRGELISADTAASSFYHTRLMENERLYGTATALLFVSAISISVYFRSKAARRSSEDPREGAGGIPFILLRLTFMLSMLSFSVAYAINPAWVRWASFGIPLWVRISGGAIAVTMLSCFFWLFKHVGRNITPTHKTRADHVLVTTGPYHWVRHPLYSAGTMFFLSMGLLSAKWIFMALVGVMVVFLPVRIPREEANLIEEFGDEYRDYMKRTGRFFPRMFT